MEGESVHEVAVGPVHAGIIEPGHFRFQCHGEHVFHLEIALGYQHRGVERLLAGGPSRRTAALVESIAGDTAVGHALASARALEALGRRRGAPARRRAAGRRAGAGAARQPRRRPRRARRRRRLPADRQLLRGAAGRVPQRARRALREPLRARPGGAGRRPVRPAGRRRGAARRAHRTTPGSGSRRRRGSSSRSPSVRDRTDGTGIARRRSPRPASGWSARRRARAASPVDVRRSHPFPPYDAHRFPLAVGEAGDVHARAAVRLEEARHSARLRRRGSSARCRPGRCAPSSPALAPAPARRLARRGVARRDLPRRDHRGPTAASRATRSSTLLPRLDGAPARDARRADLRLPALQQELQPLLLRTRPVTGLLRTRLRLGHQTIAYPEGPARFPERFRGRPAIHPGALRRAAAAPARTSARPRPSRGPPRASSRSTPAPASSAAGARRPARTGPSPSRATTGSRCAGAQELTVTRRRAPARRRARRQDEAALRPLAEAAPGLGRRVQRLRGGAQRRR